MSSQARSASDAVQRLSRHDPTLDWVDFDHGQRRTDAELAELADCLLAHPDVVRRVILCRNQLTDETGVKLARYIAASSTVRSMNLEDNWLGEATYLALAAALRVNSSLKFLLLFGNQDMDQTRIDAAFTEALQLNANRPAESMWLLYSPSDEFKRLKHAAEQLGHPSLQLLLALLC